MSLIDLAHRGELPLFQHMDRATCEWIAANNPRYDPIGQLRLGRRLDVIQHMRLSDAWFLDARTIVGLHGRRHLMRCAWYSLYLSEILGFDDRTTRTLLISSLLHDIRRQNDKGDPGHAVRAADWLRNNSQSVEDYMRIRLGAEGIATAALVIELHETPYPYFTERQQRAYSECRGLFDALKTADALDRYRLPKLTWWINDDRLTLRPPAWLKQLAFDLVLRTEIDPGAFNWSEPWHELAGGSL